MFESILLLAVFCFALKILRSDTQPNQTAEIEPTPKLTLAEQAELAGTLDKDDPRWDSQTWG